MELIAFENTKLISLFWAASNTKQPYWPRAIKLCSERYGFQSFPTTMNDFVSEKTHFRLGIFKDHPIDSFEAYSDGVVVNSKCDSSVLDEFVDDVTNWIGDEFGMRRIDTHAISKSYESDLVVRSDKNVLASLAAIERVQTAIGKHLKKTSGLDVAFQPLGYSLSPDTTEIPGMKPVPFRLERKIGISFDRNFYISRAPLPTKSHLEVLKLLEDLV
jgi:hypothetical protein